MGICDSMLMKYGTSAAGYGLIGMPVFGKRKNEYNKKVGNDTAQITRDYIRNSSLMINVAKAIGRVIVSYKEI